jgi:hypothetical protein
LAALALRDAGQITAGRDSFDAETWASEVLGSAWEAAGLLERDPEQTLCREVARRAAGHPTPGGLAAVAALRRLVGDAERHELDDAFDTLARSQPSPTWIDEPSADPIGDGGRWTFGTGGACCSWSMPIRGRTP